MPEFYMLGDPQPRKPIPNIKEYLDEQKRLARAKGKLKIGQETQSETQGQQTSANATTPANINPAEYIQIPDTNILISAYEPDFTKGFKWLPSDAKELQTKGVFYQIKQKGFAMPEPRIFMPYFVKVIEANEGKRKLNYANGNSLSRKEIEDLYKHLTINYIHGGAWSWLNARFVEGTGFKKLNLETVIGVNSDGTLITNKEPLLNCVEEDCFVDLEFNAQGFPVRKSSTQNYEQGKNLRFWYPRENSVARFDADSDWAGLSCDRSSASTYSSLGVSCICSNSDLGGRS